MQSKKNILGFTLTEIVIASGICVVVGTLLVGILVNNNGFFIKQNSVISEGVGSNDALTKINDHIRQSAGVISQYPNLSPLYVTSPTTLVLKTPSLSTDGVLENVYDYVVIGIDATHSNVLRLQTFPDSQSIRPSGNEVLTALLTTIQFKYLDSSNQEVSPPTAVSVQTTLTLANKSATTLVNLRNMP